MAQNMCSVLLLMSIGVTYAALPLHPSLLPCARSDPKFKECAVKSGNHALKAFQDGDKKYKIPGINPLEITELKTESGPKNAGISLTLKNVKVYNVADTVLDEVNIDFEKKHVLLHGVFPRLEVHGQYEIVGRILVLPITGKGDANLTLVNSRMTFNADYALETIDGNIHMSVKKSKFELDPKRMHLYFTNLFNGDKFLGKQMNEFIDENWLDVYKEVAPPIIEAFDVVAASIFNAIAKSMTFDTLFPETLPK